MSYRRLILAAAAGFLAYLLWKVINLDTSTSVSAVWPLSVTFLLVLMLPESRLQGDLFVRVVEALKGKPKD